MVFGPDERARARYLHYKGYEGHRRAGQVRKEAIGKTDARFPDRAR